MTKSGKRELMRKKWTTSSLWGGLESLEVHYKYIHVHANVKRLKPFTFLSLKVELFLQ